ncbi:MAG: hypothetical protein QE484_02010, partial [Rhizobium sp.]|nr:hypothetical protein [Rhizobium sp.]
YESDFDFYPKSLTLMSRHKILPNIFSAMGVVVCDKAFLDVLESFESGVHQVRPVRIFYKNGELIGGKFYYLNIVSRIDAIIVEKSEVRKYFDEKFTKREFFEIEIQSKRVLSKGKIEGKHIWRDRIMRTDIYISDEFYSKYKELNFRGLNEFYYAEEI